MLTARVKERKEKMNTKGSKHMTLGQRIQIEINLKVNSSCKHIAKEIGMDERSVSREIRIRRKAEANVKYGTYGKDERECKTINRFPYVCNGCKKKSSCCRKTRYFYTAKVAQEDYEFILKDSRTGLDFEYEEKQLFDETLEKGVKQGQSIYHIVKANPDKIKCSVPTVYRIINNKQTTVKRHELQRACKLKPRVHYAYKEDNRSIREGRRYMDFLAAYTKNPFGIFTQMDTVEGPKDQKECLLTLHIPNTRLMFGKIMKSQSKECVAKAFEQLQDELGYDLYKLLFSIVLTDRGTEFCDPESIEVFKKTGEKVGHVYFCNSYASYQKGAIEENHTLVRYVIPKQTYFDTITQDKVNLMFSHINSYCRESLEGSTPFSASLILLGKDALEKTKIRPITPDLVNVTPKLLK